MNKKIVCNNITHNLDTDINIINDIRQLLSFDINNINFSFVYNNSNCYNKSTQTESTKIINFDKKIQTDDYTIKTKKKTNNIKTLRSEYNKYQSAYIDNYDDNSQNSISKSKIESDKLIDKYKHENNKLWRMLDKVNTSNKINNESFIKHIPSIPITITPKDNNTKIINNDKPSKISKLKEKINNLKEKNKLNKEKYSKLKDKYDKLITNKNKIKENLNKTLEEKKQLQKNVQNMANNIITLENDLINITKENQVNNEKIINELNDEYKYKINLLELENKRLKKELESYKSCTNKNIFHNKILNSSLKLSDCETNTNNINNNKDQKYSESNYLNYIYTQSTVIESLIN